MAASKPLLLALNLAGLILVSGCSNLMASGPPAVPSGSARVPVNKAPAMMYAKPGGPVPAQYAPQYSSPSSFVMEGKTSRGQEVKVSLFSTLQKIAEKTGMRFMDNNLPDEVVLIVPAKDPLDVLRQLSKKSSYQITLDREQGRLWVGQESKKNGLVVIRDQNPVTQIGAPITLRPMPQEPVLLAEAMRLLAPEDFDIGYAENIDANIEIDLKSVKSWTEGVERIAFQTPYRIVFDWEKRLVYAVPVLKKGY